MKGILRVLNVGCGKDKRGSIRVDVDRSSVANIICDAQHLPFIDRSFDLVFCFSVIEHIPRWDLAVSECCRVCDSHAVFEVPVNSDLRVTEGLRLLIPTRENIKLFFSTPERAREHIWQFSPRKLKRSMMVLAPHFKVEIQKVFQMYRGVPSRCYRVRCGRLD